MSIETFKKLHQGSEPFIIGNVWDAHSAQLAEKAGYKALGSSSHAIANLLGYADGQNISIDEILFMVDHIVKAVDIPVSVDFEAGYSSDPEEVADAVQKLAKIGVVGINLEDGVVKDGKRQLEGAPILEAKIKAIRAKTDIFINARTDTYVTKHEDAKNESVKRVKLYTEAGADGIFIPLIAKEEDIAAIVSVTDLPLNVFAIPTIPTFDTLAKLGVKRISYGAKVYEKVIESAEAIFKGIQESKSFEKIV